MCIFEVVGALILTLNTILDCVDVLDIFRKIFLLGASVDKSRKSIGG